MSYRVEVSVSNRAICAATQCKKEKIKIAKGELRHGTFVQTPDFQTWKYRHWGCVTPTVLHNWWETAEKNLELVDGFDELPEPCQAQVLKALEEVHVADEDWNGDIECNRYDPKNKSQGMFLKGKAKAEKEAAEAIARGEEPPTPVKKTNKRARDADAEEDPAEDVKPAKKGKKAAANDESTEPSTQAEPKPAKRGKKLKAEIEDEPAEEKPAKKSRAKKVKDEPVDEDDAEAVSEPAPKKSRAKKVKTEEPEPEADVEPDLPAPKKGRAKKATTDSDEKPTKKTKKAAESTEDAAPKRKAAPRRKKSDE